MPPWLSLTGAGAAVGFLFGVFGVGGSSFATPVLGLLGVPGLVAVAAPLPAAIPAAAAGAYHFVRRGQVDWRIARWSITGGAPATVAGALLSREVGGKALLVASGLMLAVVGFRIVLPIPSDKRLAGRARRRAAVVVPAAAAIGLFTGLLANGGGFLLVPLFVLVLGLTMPESAGTSLVVIAALSVPTLVSHWLLGHIDWSVSLPFAAGAVPGAFTGSVTVAHVAADRLRRAFGLLLMGFSAFFVVYRLRS
ncbi:MAG TPA: sulfite exporter TauE/SafE family protein [Acidimicrobiales bacterium]|nr:sulfite exporter TauE/SafE family protein [Acidimicrobiales bacterium]